PLFLRVSGVIATAVSLAGTMLLYFLAVKAGVSASEYVAFNAAFGHFRFPKKLVLSKSYHVNTSFFYRL
ncbi:MAG: hypothetical protein IIY78_04115, partial [Clostridia bacterium]|nr:hypothetical protein [Clostridia bacterium]